MISFISFILAFGIITISTVAAESTSTASLEHDHLQDEFINPSKKDNKFSVKDFQQLLFTEIDDELQFIKKNVQKVDEALTTRDDFGRKLQQDGVLDDMALIEELYVQDVFDHIINHAWTMSKSVTLEERSEKKQTYSNTHHPRKKSRYLSFMKNHNNNDNNEGKLATNANLFPFLVCSRSPLLQSGLQRLAPMLQFTGAQKEDAIVVSNDRHQTCFHVLTSHEKASILDKAISNDEYVILPMAGKSLGSLRKWSSLLV